MNQKTKSKNKYSITRDKDRGNNNKKNDKFNKSKKKYTNTKDILLNKNHSKDINNHSFNHFKKIQNSNSNNRLKNIDDIYYSNINIKNNKIPRFKKYEKKLKKYEQIKTEQNIEKLKECTFKPDMSKTINRNLSYNKKHITTNNDNDNNKSFNYVDFYQYKKSKENKKENKIKKSNEKNILIKKNVNNKKLKLKEIKNDTDIKTSNNKKFLEFHSLIIQKSLKELNNSKN